MTVRNEIFLEIFAGQYKYFCSFMTFFRTVDAYVLYSTFLSYPKSDKFIDIYTSWKKKYE